MSAKINETMMCRTICTLHQWSFEECSYDCDELQPTECCDMKLNTAHCVTRGESVRGSISVYTCFPTINKSNCFTLTCSRIVHFKSYESNLMYTVSNYPSDINASLRKPIGVILKRGEDGILSSMCKSSSERATLCPPRQG